MPRDNFKESIKVALRDRVAHRCSNPECRVPTAAPGSGATKVVRGGDAAHITAASPKGPRYDDSISATERSSIENGIWLCVVCARKIDHDRNAYSAELLREWKKSAETAAGQEFGKPLITDAHLHTQTQTGTTLGCLPRRSCLDRPTFPDRDRKRCQAPRSVWHYSVASFSCRRSESPNCCVAVENRM